MDYNIRQQCVARGYNYRKGYTCSDDEPCTRCLIDREYHDGLGT